jgi:NAD(P)H-quinone oxidoreductase subunit 5
MIDALLSYIAGAEQIRFMMLGAIPLLYLVIALLPQTQSAASHPIQQFQQLMRHWRLARLASGLALILALVSVALIFISPLSITPGYTLISWEGVSIISTGIRADFLTVVLLLVAFIGWVIVGYSQSYLAGEKQQPRYIRALMTTLTAVALVILTNNLLVLALAWLSTSLSLHQLLTFYPDRVAAQIAAHKKFLASRLADVCLFSAVALIAVTLGTLEIDEILSRAAALNTYPTALTIAVVLLAITALLKCAQLPLHGWLIQVMEAPTPVSALLHAGVVNLGGFVLIRFASLVSEVPAAQTLLVVIGALSACIAALVMMTRISIKVTLAWSTCAQMGFMLMQCGLGLYELALLHLLAHSLYKAYAFLSAGGAVATSQIKFMTPHAAPHSLTARVLSGFVGVGIVMIAATIWRVDIPSSLTLITMASILALALTPLLVISPKVNIFVMLSACLGVALIYFGLHHLFIIGFDASQLAHSGQATTPTETVLVMLVLALFFGLFIVQSVIRATPNSPFAKRLYPWFYGGLYLDELFTRVTFRLYPLTPSTPATRSVPDLSTTK